MRGALAIAHGFVAGFVSMLGVVDGCARHFVEAAVVLGLGWLVSRGRQ